MLYRRLADFVVVIHFLVAIFFFGGGFLVPMQYWVGMFHIPLALWVCGAFIIGWTCPLTPLENRFRKLAGEQGYHVSFVDQYIARFVGLMPPSKEAPVSSKRSGRRREVMLGLILCVYTASIYGINSLPNRVTVQLDLRNNSKSTVLLRHRGDTLVLHPKQTGGLRFAAGDTLTVFAGETEASPSKSLVLEERRPLNGTSERISAEVNTDDPANITFRYDGV